MAEASGEVREMQFHKIRADPTSHYAEPDEVVTDDRFETSQKIDILAQWGKDLMKLDPDAAASKDPLSDRSVKRVVHALEALGADPQEVLKLRSW